MLDVPYLISAGLKIVCFALIGIYLLAQWVKLEKKYTSDIPFLFGVGLLLLIPGVIIDILFSLSIVGYGLIINIRYALDLVCMLLFLGSLLSVWMASRVKLRYIVITIMTVVSVTFMMFIPCVDSTSGLDTFHAIISLPSIIIVIITFLFTYLTKRLTNVHGLLISIAAIIVLISQVARPLLKPLAVSEITPLGLAWVANLIGIAGWIVLYFGFKYKPSFLEKL